MFSDKSCLRKFLFHVILYFEPKFVTDFRKFIFNVTLYFRSHVSSNNNKRYVNLSDIVTRKLYVRLPYIISGHNPISSHIIYKFHISNLSCTTSLALDQMDQYHLSLKVQHKM